MTSNADTGLCIPYTVRVTPDKGRGIFADTAVRKGTTIWRHVPRQYAVYDEQLLRELLAKSSHSEAVYELTHIHSVAEFPGYMIRVFDDGILINHSAQPTLVINAGSGDYEVLSVASVQDVVDALLNSHFTDLIATRTLAVGDELTLDYNADPEDPPYYDTLCDQYGVSWECEWL
jgi:SET domain-containing protein